jgi:phage-related minor tail protein
VRTIANNIKGITVEINGDTGPLDKALKGVNKSSYDLKSELKQVEKALKLDPSNTVLLQQKQKLLAESVTNTKSKLDTLKEAEKQVQEQFKQGKIGEEQYRALQREVIKTEDELRNLAGQAAESGVTLNKVSDGAEKVGEAASNVAETMAPVTLTIAGIGAAAAKMGSDFVESTNKVDVAFGKSADSVKEFSKTTLDNFGIAAGTSLDMAAGYGDMATSMGLPQAAAAKMSEKLVGLGGDLASFKNIGIAEANTALSSIFTGETESLKKLGIVMTQANLQEFAASKGIKTKIQDMTQSEQVQLRYNYVMEKTKNAQGDFARTSDGAANSTRVATESVKQAAASFGLVLAPMIAKAAQYLGNLAKSFAGLSEHTKKTIIIILEIVAAIAPLAFLISGITTVIGAAVGAFAVINGVIAVLTTGVAAATPLIGGLAAVIGFIISPVGLVIIAIIALIAIFALLWTHCEGFRNFWIGLWEGIKAATKVTVDALVNFFTVTIPNGWNILVAFFIGIPAWFSGLWTGIKTSTMNIWNSIKEFFSAVWIGIVSGVMAILNPFIVGITNVFNSLKAGVAIIFEGFKLYFTGVWNAIKLIFLGPILLICDLLTGNFGKAKTDLVKIFTGLQEAFGQIWAGIKLVFTGVVTAIVGFLTLQWNGIVNITTTIWNGLKTFMSGLWEGIKATASNAWNGLKSTVTSICNAIVQGAKDIWNGLISFFTGLPSKLRSIGSNMFTSMRSGVTSTISGVTNAITSGFNNAISFITGLPGKALGWGKDFVQGLIDGITGMIDKVGSAVKGVADKITSFLHFSVPDEGPLTDYESWMPDFMDGLAKGIANSKSVVTNAIKGLSTDMSVGMSLSPEMLGVSSSSNKIASGNTANDNSKSIVQHIVINSPAALSPSETARQNKRALQELALSF